MPGKLAAKAHDRARIIVNFNTVLLDPCPPLLVRRELTGHSCDYNAGDDRG